MNTVRQNDQVFFPGINGLRFFAALAVIITHIELLKGVFGFRHYWTNPFIFNLGGLGVYFFFVLSGFLITFLLLKEKEKFGTIRIKAFYIRRILRIWPLYYLVLILGFFVLPHFPGIRLEYLESSFNENFSINLALYLLILPNLAFSAFPAVPHIGQLWSIGVEEQFYLGWPWLIRRAQNILRSLIVLIVIIILIKVVVLLAGKLYGGQRWYGILKNFVAMSKFECMAIGGIGAWFLFSKKERILGIIYNRFVCTISVLLIPVLVYITPASIQDGIHIVFSFIFLIIIMNTARNSGFIKLENRILDFLGKISYGIYMYHFMVIPPVLYAYKVWGLNLGEAGFNIFVYFLSIVLTTGIAAASYYLFEKRFIRFKSKFALIKSGEAVNAGDKR